MWPGGRGGSRIRGPSEPPCEKLDTLEMAGRAGAKNWENCTQKITTINPQITTINIQQ